MGEDWDEGEDLFNDDRDDNGFGGNIKRCPDCDVPLKQRAEGRAILNYCETCDFTEWE